MFGTPRLRPGRFGWPKHHAPDLLAARREADAVNGARRVGLDVAKQQDRRRDAQGFAAVAPRAGRMEAHPFVGAGRQDELARREVALDDGSTRVASRVPEFERAFGALGVVGIGPRRAWRPIYGARPRL
ncbi:hypothetical protein [Methylocella sp.]|uniref:hypothetical protein n=1 Tax=Methylocella sp. TaxID=1978226 RepID=UPI0035AF7BF5